MIVASNAAEIGKIALADDDLVCVSIEIRVVGRSEKSPLGRRNLSASYPCDYILSKLERNAAKDRDDAGYIFTTPKLNPRALREKKNYGLIWPTRTVTILRSKCGSTFSKPQNDRGWELGVAEAMRCRP